MKSNFTNFFGKSVDIRKNSRYNNAITAKAL